MRKLAALATGLMLIVPELSLAQPATQAPECAPFQKVLKTLEEKFKEHPIFVGAIDKDNNTFIMITVNPENKSWTQLLINLDRDLACLIKDGPNYTIIAPHIVKPPTTEG